MAFAYAVKKLSNAVKEEEEATKEAQEAYDRGEYNQWGRSIEKQRKAKKEKCRRAAKAVERGLKIIKPSR